MGTQCSRREFFVKASGAIAAVVTGVTPGRVYASNPINYQLEGFDEERFGEETLLASAMNILAARFQDRRIWQAVYDAGARYYISGQVMEQSNLIDTRQNRRNLLWHQLYWLSQSNAPDDTEPSFPRVVLRAFHESSRVLAKAPLDEVVVRSVGRNIRQSGSFRLLINRYKLASGGSGSDPEEWAGTIAHEMLHNLGHTHSEAGDADYEDWQIIVFDNAVIRSGGYYYGAKKSQTVCGCPTPAAAFKEPKNERRGVQ
jgi:hypothetical protein